MFERNNGFENKVYEIVLNQNNIHLSLESDIGVLELFINNLKALYW